MAMPDQDTETFSAKQANDSKLFSYDSRKPTALFTDYQTKNKVKRDLPSKLLLSREGERVETSGRTNYNNNH